MNPYESEILIMAGNRVALSFALNFLGKQGYRVDGAVNYLDALKKIEADDFSLVVFVGEIANTEKDYVENITSELKPDIQFLHFSGPVQQLPDRINQMLQKN